MGRPSSYQPEYAEQARKLCELGATDPEIAAFFEVHLRTIANWKLKHEDFLHALKRSKIIADDGVEQSLYRRAMGYSGDAEKVMPDGSVVSYTAHYPPDTTACIFWLKNRQPVRWRDRTEQEVSGRDGGPVEIVKRVIVDPARD